MMLQQHVPLRACWHSSLCTRRGSGLDLPPKQTNFYSIYFTLYYLVFPLFLFAAVRGQELLHDKHILPDRTPQFSMRPCPVPLLLTPCPTIPYYFHPHTFLRGRLWNNVFCLITCTLLFPLLPHHLTPAMPPPAPHPLPPPTATTTYIA